MSKLVTITLSSEHAQALHWLLRHLSFEDALKSVPLHLEKDVRKERAYEIVHAASAMEDALAEVGKHGDSWMYRDDTQLGT